MADEATLRAEDLIPVQSRVSWGPIFAGAVVALACYLVLTLLGAAVGLSVTDRVRPENLGTGAAIWAIVSTAVALFVGGWVTSQCTVGENKLEAFMHGLIMWGVVVAILLWLVATGIRSGFNAMVGMTNVSQATAGDLSAQDWQAAARRAGVPQERIDQWHQSLANAPESVRRAAQDPDNQQAVASAVTSATWWTLIGTLLSMAAAIAGAIFGSGPNFRLLPLSGPVGRPAFAHRPAVART